jgi:hypothetical protein
MQEKGVWKHISPPEIDFSLNDVEGDYVMQSTSVALDPCNPAIVYTSITAVGVEGQSGIWRSTDAGGSWSLIAPFDTPVNVAVDPADPLHMYVTDAVWGTTNGFWISHDGGNTWYLSEGFKAAAEQIGTRDVYTFAPNPTDFNHVLVTFHYYWNGTGSAGFIESHDGGETFALHQPTAWSGAGHTVEFLYEPSLGIGDSNTWLYGVQEQGFLRTTDAGATWTQVTGTGLEPDVKSGHGHGQTYYSPSGTLYSNGTPSLMKSSDNGITWSTIGPFGSYLGVIGDGKNLIAAPMNGGDFVRAAESDDENWASFSSGLALRSGTKHMAVDKQHSVVYAPTLLSGLWAINTSE